MQGRQKGDFAYNLTVALNAVAHRRFYRPKQCYNVYAKGEKWISSKLHVKSWDPFITALVRVRTRTTHDIRTFTH